MTKGIEPNHKPEVGTAISSFGENWDMGFHSHAGIELSVVLEGKGNFQCDGLNALLEKGDVVLIQSNVLHRYNTVNNSIRFAVLDFQFMPSLFLEGFLHLLAGQAAKVLRFSKMHLEQYEALFRIWLRSLSEQTVEVAALITAWGNLFLVFIQQNGRPQPALLSVSTAEDYIRNQLNGDLKVAELALLCGLSESSFRRAFHASYGMSPKQYQQECRMTEAKWLLRSSDNTIQQVADQVGFAGVHAFSAWFHLKDGLPPSEWRRQQIGRFK
jgi:AraC family transcriptional regulator